MKKLLILVFLLTNVIAKVNAKRLPGYYITTLGDTTHVIFNIPVKSLEDLPNFEKLHYRIKYYDKNKNKFELKPNDVREVVFDYKGYLIRMVSEKNTLQLGSVFSSHNQIFLHLVRDGKLRLYKYYSSNRAPATNASQVQYPAETHILKKRNEELFRPGYLTFKKDMVAYLAECPELVSKIESRRYRAEDIIRIVEEYNENCGD
jgi:hypothetical protein